MRPIDADALKETIHKNFMSGSSIIRLWDLIDKLDTIDAVSVIRCKDCKYGVSEVNALGEFMIGCEHRHSPMKLGTYLLDPDFYCADGERREDDAKAST